MDTALQGKVILVTGGAKRVGAAICRRLHEMGASIMIHYRSSRNEALALESEFNGGRPGSAALIQADLLDLAALQGLVTETVARFGGMDALINNASSFYPTPVGEITAQAWNDLIGTNLRAPLFLSQAAVPELRKRRGCIVNIADIHAERPMKRYLVYSVGKAGLVALSRSLARELSPEVRVNAVAPGTILWPEDGPWSDQAARQSIVERIPLKRTGEPEDIAQAVAFLIAEAPYVTGQVLAVDGGRSVTL